MVFLSAGRNSISVNWDDSWWVPRWQSLPGAFTECNSRVKTHVFWKISYFLQIPLPPTLPQVGFSEKWGRLKSPGCSQVATRPLDSRRRGLCLQRRLCPGTPLSQSPGSQLWTELTALQTTYFLPWKHGSTLPAASGKGVLMEATWDWGWGQGVHIQVTPRVSWCLSPGRKSVSQTKKLRLRSVNCLRPPSWRQRGSCFLNTSYRNRFKKWAPLCFHWQNLP